MAAVATCPTCEQATFDGVCRRCAFSAALAGVCVESLDTQPDPRPIAAPAGYALLHELGAGATAVVWLARERALDRLVALKFISAPADRRLLQRLMREGHAAATLRHPHIVAVHAMDATDAHAFLAMDYVEGGDLRKRLARGLPSARETAELLRKLADALAHAHAKGILHRDVKPSNVLLDTLGEPQLADFGLAAPLEGGGDLTLPGQVAGTAAYLAPELLAGADRASPASDLYSLGAVLYECLTGRPPFVGDSTAAIFAQLATSEPPAPRLLRPDVPRDLATICEKCLEKTPARRYASAAALRDDLDCFLRGDAIAARLATRREQTVRWCRRHPGTAAFGSLAAALLLGLAIGGPLVAMRLARARAEAIAEAAASAAVSAFLQNDLLAQADPDREPDRDLKLRAVLDRAAEHIDRRFPDQPLVASDIRETIAKTYFSLGENEAARRQWEQVRALRLERLGAEHPKTLRAAAALFDALRALGKLPEAESLAHEVTAALRRVLGPEHRETLSALINLAVIYRAQGKLAAAEELYVQLAPVCRRIFGPEDRETLTLSSNLATVYSQQGKYADAERLNRELVEIRRRTLGPEHPQTLISMYNLALCWSRLDLTTEAETLGRQVLEMRQRVLGQDHPHTLASMTSLAMFMHETGKLAEAEALDLEIIAIQKKKFGAEHSSTLITMSNLARLYRDAGKLAEAEALNLATLEGRRRVLGAKHPYTLQSMGQLAANYRDAGRLTEASRLASEMLAGCEGTLGLNHPLTVQAWSLRGSLFAREENFSAAEPLLRRAAEAYAKVTAEPWRTALIQSQLGRTLLHLQRHDEAEPLLLASHETLQKNFSRIPPTTQQEIVAAAREIARLYTVWHRPEKAQAWSQRLAELRPARAFESPPVRSASTASKSVLP